MVDLLAGPGSGLPAVAPRVGLVGAEGAPLLARELFAGGDPGPVVASMAQVPELLGPTLPFLGAVLGPSWIDLRDKEIAILRTSAVMGCRSCTEAHTVVALDAGLTRDEVRFDLAPELTITADGAFWAPFAPTVRSGVLDTDLLLTRTVRPLSRPLQAMLTVVGARPAGADSTLNIR